MDNPITNRSFDWFSMLSEDIESSIEKFSFLFPNIGEPQANIKLQQEWHLNYKQGRQPSDLRLKLQIVYRYVKQKFSRIDRAKAIGQTAFYYLPVSAQILDDFERSEVQDSLCRVINRYFDQVAVQGGICARRDDRSFMYRLDYTGLDQLSPLDMNAMYHVHTHVNTGMKLQTQYISFSHGTLKPLVIYALWDYMYGRRAGKQLSIYMCPYKNSHKVSYEQVDSLISWPTPAKKFLKEFRELVFEREHFTPIAEFPLNHYINGACETLANFDSQPNPYQRKVWKRMNEIEKHENKMACVAEGSWVRDPSAYKGYRRKERVTLKKLRRREPDLGSGGIHLGISLAEMSSKLNETSSTALDL